MSESNLSTFELMDARVRLADDVSVVPIAHGCEKPDELSYQIKLASQGRFFQIGYAEYVLCSLLNGGNTIAQAMTLTSRVIPSDSFTEEQVSQLITWLIDNGLAVPVNEQGRHLALAKRKTQSRWQWNPFWTKLPFASPDQFLEKIFPAFRWFASPWMLLAVIVMWFLAGNALANHWDEFVGSSRHLFSSTNWIWLGLAWIGLKLVHELAHGIVCKKYGGKVPEAGIIMILFAPMAFVDATSSWGFSSKWQRIHVAAAGMIVELMIAALAIIFWAETSSEALQFMLYNIVIMSGVSTAEAPTTPFDRWIDR